MPVNGTIGFAAPREGAEAALQAIEAGFTTLKLKAGAERETEDLVERVRGDPRARSAPTSGSGSTSTAPGTCRRRRTGSRRSPASTSSTSSSRSPADDAAGAAELRRLVPVPIAADEAVYAAVAPPGACSPRAPPTSSS